MLWSAIPFLCFLYFIGRATNQSQENHQASKHQKQHCNTSSWLHAYVTTPSQHSHLVCLFNYLLLVIFLSSYRFHLCGRTLIQVRILVPCSIPSIQKTVLDNIPFPTLWSRLQVKNYFQAKKLSWTEILVVLHLRY